MTSKITLLVCCIAVILISPLSYAQGQTVVSGKVKSGKTKESLSVVSVLIKGTNIGAYTDDRGNFKFSTSQKPPFTLVLSSVGFVAKEVEFSGQALDVELADSYALGDEVVVSVTRTSQKYLEAPGSVDIVSRNAIRTTPGASYYDALNHLKGVDITTSSYTFKTVSTRGFNGSGNLRFNQMVDGMDNTTPALNFSVGNVIGLTELDVDNMELLSGASSALYGSGGMNGTLLISSKDPFKYQGLSFQIKQGAMHIGDSRSGATPFYDWSLRWGVKVSDKFAFKVGAEYVKADDWQADDKTNLLRQNVISETIPGTRESDPNYDGVNVYGDEASASMQGIAQVGIFGPSNTTLPSVIQILAQQLQRPPTPNEIVGYYSINPQYGPLNIFALGLVNNVYGSQLVSRTGYDEKNMVDYNAKNLKFSGGLYYNLTSTTQMSFTANYGSGTSVYTGADRYSLKNFTIGQYKFEIKNTNWFVRAYTTQENSGDSYASTLASLTVNNKWKDNGMWFGEYTANYAGAVLQQVPSDVAHTLARQAADEGRYQPGSKEFNAALNEAITTPISASGGAQFADKSDLYQLEGQANLTPYIKFVNVLVGASYRWYDLNSRGTIFADTAGRIKIGEWGGYLQLQKALLKDVLVLSASGRYDKNENFDGRFTPRVTALIKVAKDNHIRMSYQQAYRFPTNQDQWINLRTPGSVLIGCLPGFNDYYKFSSNPVYTSESVLAYRTSVGAGQANPGLLKIADFAKAKPESVSSFELGYRGIIAKNLLVDAYIYTSKYQDFIARSAVARGASGNPATSIAELSNPFTTTNFSFVTNSPTPVKANGWGIGLDYQIGRKGYKVMANIYGDKLKDIPTGLVTFFNTPKTRYNLGFANANVYKGLGFNVLYKWQDDVYWEGTFGTSTIPSFGTVDLLLSYKIGKSSNLIKLGATNLFNNYYRNAFGNPYIGGLYYVSFGYNVF